MGKRFDPLVKRLLARTAPRIIELATGEKPQKIKPLPTELRFIRTLVVDALFLADQNLFQVEIQTRYEKNLAYRMLKYWIAIRETHGREPFQIVLWLGKGNPPPSRFKTPFVDFSFILIDMRKVKPEFFLESEEPDEVLLAVLAGEREKKLRVIKMVVDKLAKICGRGEKFLKYIEELDLLVGLFDVRLEVGKMAIELDIRKSSLYREGLKEGLSEGLREAILLDVEMKFGRGKRKVVKRRIDKISDIDVLRKLKRKVIRAKSWEEFSRELEALTKKL